MTGDGGHTGEHLRKPAGAFNATKCARYLRWIGADVSDETVESWLISERVHRFIGSQRKTVRTCGRNVCAAGHDWFAVQYRGRITKAKQRQAEEAARCPECGDGPVFWQIVWAETREGAIHDFRSKSDQWQPLPLHDLEQP